MIIIYLFCFHCEPICHREESERKRERQSGISSAICHSVFTVQIVRVSLYIVSRSALKLTTSKYVIIINLKAGAIFMRYYSHIGATTAQHASHWIVVASDPACQWRQGRDKKKKQKQKQRERKKSAISFDTNISRCNYHVFSFSFSFAVSHRSTGLLPLALFVCFLLSLWFDRTPFLPLLSIINFLIIIIVVNG